MSPRRHPLIESYNVFDYLATGCGSTIVITRHTFIHMTMIMPLYVYLTWGCYQSTLQGVKHKFSFNEFILTELSSIHFIVILNESTSERLFLNKTILGSNIESNRVTILGKVTVFPIMAVLWS